MERKKETERIGRRERSFLLLFLLSRSLGREVIEPSPFDLSILFHTTCSIRINFGALLPSILTNLYLESIDDFLKSRFHRIHMLYVKLVRHSN